MATAINLANLSMSFDYSKVKNGTDITRKEIGSVARIMRETEPATDKYNRDLTALKKAYDAGAIGADRYAKAIDHIKQKYGVGLPDTRVTDQLAKLPGGEALASFQALGPAGFAAAGGVAAVAGSIMLAKQAVSGFVAEANRIDSVVDRANALGMSYSELVIAQRALGEVAGIGPDEVSQAMQKMQLNLVEARQGTNDLAKSLKSLGLDPDKLLKQGNLEAIKTVSAEIVKMENPAEQMKLAFDMFGKSGVALVSALRAGSDPIAEMENHLRSTGLLLSDIQAQGVGNMNDALGRANDHLQGMTTQLTANIAPAVAGVANSFVKIADALGGAEKNNYFAPLVDQAAKIASYTSLWTMAIQQARPSIVALGVEQRKIDEETAKAAQVKREANLLAVAEQKKLEDAQKEQDRIAKSLKQTFDSQLDTLTKQRDELQKSKEIAVQESAIRNGFTEQQAKQLAMIQREIDAEKEKVKLREKEKQRIAELVKDSEQFAKSILKPMEALDFELERMQKLIDIGAIDQKQFNAGAMKAAEGAQQAQNKNVSATFAPALKAGTVEAYKFILSQRDKASQLAERQAMLAERGVKVNEQIRDEIRKLPKIGAAR